MTVTDLRCEYRANPLGLDALRPRLSWKLESARRGARQTAYQILVASSEEALRAGQADLWDSGKVESDQSGPIAYEGKALASGQRAWWTARAWDENGEMAQTSASAWWEMGLLDPSDWQAEWIGADLVGGPRTSSPCPFLRRTFTLDRPVKSARLYATALGVYECHLNGQRVGKDIFTPGWTDYSKRVQYQTYDVTSLLQGGENALGAILGDGWYCGFVEARPRQHYGDRPKLRAQLVVAFADGSTQTVATDGGWQTAFGPLLEADLIMGESYDARREMPGWDRPGFDAARWRPVEVFADAGVPLTAQAGPTVRAFEELAPIVDQKELPQWPASKWVYDLGQNMVGRVRLKVSGPAGTTVTLRYAEVLNPDGSAYFTNLRSARATDYYTLKGDGEEVWEPRFTFHGFRYVEVTGYPGKPPVDAVTGIVLHSDIPPTGEFECSDPLLNQLQHNIQWGQKGNFLEAPTDCPQRDERLGWTGDAQVFVRTAAFNRDVAGFFHKWMRDVRDAQHPKGGYPHVVPNVDPNMEDGGPAWADAGLICPWTLYLCYGDLQFLSEHYDSLTRWMTQLTETSQNGLRIVDGWQGFGDWLALDGSGKTDGGTPKDLIGTAFFAHAAQRMAEIARLLDKPKEAASYERQFAEIKAAFQNRFVTPGGLVAGGTQTGMVLALHFGLLPDELRPSVAEALVRDIKERGTHLSTGFVGTPYLLHVLTQTGHLDVAYALLHQKTWPSWLYSVTQGATTIWERWDGWTHDKGFQDAGMNSFNHYAYGAVGDWLYAVVAGIDLDPNQPGYKHIIFRPRFGGGLTSAAATLASVHGTISSHWRWNEGAFAWDITVPPNTTATVYVPSDESSRITEGETAANDAANLRFLRREAGAAIFEAQSGLYQLRVEKNPPRLG